jgi:hypothetical protein
MKNHLKNTAILTLLSISAFTAQTHALSMGDFAITTFNLDEDGFCLVPFVDVAANSTFYFSDGAGTSPTAIGSLESSFQWVTGGAPIAAGTVVRFSAIDVASRAASVGTFTVVNTTNLGLSATSETLYAFEGTSDTVATQILTAATTVGTAAELTPVGLTAGTDAISLTASTDFAQYTGPRSGLAAFADYRPLVNNPANWNIIVGGANDAVVPNTTAFTIVPEPSTCAVLISGTAMLLGLRRRRA